LSSVEKSEDRGNKVSKRQDEDNSNSSTDGIEKWRGPEDRAR